MTPNLTGLISVIAMSRRRTAGLQSQRGFALAQTGQKLAALEAQLTRLSERLGVAPVEMATAEDEASIPSPKMSLLAEDESLSLSMTNWRGSLRDYTWMRLRPLFAPVVPLSAVLALADADTEVSSAAVLQLYTWERERILTLAKGIGGSAITVLVTLIAAAIQGKIAINLIVQILAIGLVIMLLLWAGLLLAGLRRLTEEYTVALRFCQVE
jgi:hypothetical protein